jgi:hypothetical protein
MSVIPQDSENESASRAIRTREVLMRELRILLQSRDDEEPQNRLFEALVLEAIDDLVGAAMTREWNDVGAVEIDAAEGEWHVFIRLSREPALREHTCVRRRGREWR